MRVRTARDRRDLRRFIDLPYRLHARDPLWVPPLRRDVEALLSRSKNPFFEHAEAEYFVAERGDEVVGRIAAISNRLHNETHNDRVGFFGFFECIDDQVVADALFAAAGQWCGQHGHDVVRGPASFSVNDECGLLVEGFDTPPVLMMPHNPPYYATLHDGYGLVKAKDLWVYESPATGHPEHIQRITRAVQLAGKRRGITLRALDMTRFAAEVETLKGLYNAAWERNWGFVPMTDAEIEHLAKQLKPIVVPDLVCFAERNAEVIGFAVALPDLNQALSHNPSGRLFPGILRVLWHARKVSRLRILLLGVLNEYRGTGVDAVMYHWIWTKAVARGYRWGEAGWILEDNWRMNNAVVRLGFRRYKTYRIYDKAL